MCSSFAFLGGFQPEERLFLAWYARYFADGWHAWLDHNGISGSDDFISTNQYACIKINADSLLLYYHWLCSHDALRRNVSACPVGAGSQQNENQFRAMQAMSNDPNFTLGEFIRRLAIVQAQEIIKAKRASLFHFPKHHKHVYNDHIRRDLQFLPANFSEHRACELLAAMSTARADLAALGAVLPPQQALAASPVVTTTTDLHDDLDAVPSFIEDAELEALPEGFLDPDSDADSDVGDYDNSDFEDECSKMSNTRVPCSVTTMLPVLHHLVHHSCSLTPSLTRTLRRRFPCLCPSSQDLSSIRTLATLSTKAKLLPKSAVAQRRPLIVVLSTRR